MASKEYSASLRLFAITIWVDTANNFFMSDLSASSQTRSMRIDVDAQSFLRPHSPLAEISAAPFAALLEGYDVF